MSDSRELNFKLTKDGEKIMAALKELSGTHVQVGFQSGLDTHTDKNGKHPVDMCLVAAYNEFGSSTTPARPFLKNSLELHKEEITNLCGAEIRQIVKGKQDAAKTANQVGSACVGVVQKEITDGTYAPNAPSTIRKKGSSHPLIDTGQMRQSIHYFIEKEEE